MSTSGFTPELTAYIVDRLAKQDNPDDIVMDVCRMTGLTWNEVETRLQIIQEEEGEKIARRQFPLLTGVALFFFTAGLLLTGYGVFALVSGAGGLPGDITSYFMPVIEQGIDPAEAMQPAILPYLQIAVTYLISPFSALFFGVAMLAGSLLGMRKAWATILAHE